MALPWFKPEPIEIPFLPDWWPEQGRYVHWFGALVACAVLVGSNVAIRRARREGIHPSVMGEMAAYVMVGGFVLGHMLDAVFYHWEVVVQNPLFVLQLWNGLSSFGGFVGACIGGLVWIKSRGYPLIPFADITSYAFPFGWIFGRLGCFVVHDHPGVVTDFPLAVADYHIRGGHPPWQTRHDLGLYEVFWCLLVIPLFWWLGQKKRPRGFYFALLPLLYAPVRFGLDFLRETDASGGDPRILFGLTPGHFGAMLLFAGGLAVAWRVRQTGGRFALPREARWTAEDDEREDRRGVEALLETLDEPRGARRVTAPIASGDHVARWPGALMVADLRDADDIEALGAELEGLGDGAHHVLRLDADELDEALVELVEDWRGDASTAAVIDASQEEHAEAVAQALGVEVWLAREDGGAPWALLERDDGGVVFGFLGEPAAAAPPPARGASSEEE